MKRTAFVGALLFVASLTKAQTPTQEYLVGATLYTLESAEYRALCYQAYALATLRLKEAMTRQPERPAVILDLDETVLDNSTYTAWQIAVDSPYTPQTWKRWTDLAAAPAIPGAAAFLSLADSLGVALFYVSNRLVAEKEATMRNMRSLGLPQVEDDHFFLKTTSSGKSARRDSIAAMGYTVLFLIGDNLGDFDAAWDRRDNASRRSLADQEHDRFGDRYIVLPNALYGTWEGAVYDFNWNLSMPERDARRRQVIGEGVPEF